MKARAIVAQGILLLACAGPQPIVQHRTFARTDAALASVAIVPFTPTARIVVSLTPGGNSPGEAAALVSRFVYEAFEARGTRAISASDVGLAFDAAGVTVRNDPLAAAAIAARKFGASAVVLGDVSRYRERVGGSYGVERPASVAFQFTLYTAPEGLRVFSVRFDETQVQISANPQRARQYPSYGSRWLTAAELARWGADKALETIPASIR